MKVRERSPLGGGDSARLRGRRPRINYRTIPIHNFGYGMCPVCLTVDLTLKRNWRYDTYFLGCASWPKCSYTCSLTGLDVA